MTEASARAVYDHCVECLKHMVYKHNRLIVVERANQHARKYGWPLLNV